MSLFGSLFTGVSALSAQSQTTAIISNNIANVNTTGFKRSESTFESLVTSQSRSSLYSPGTVAINRIQRVDQQGPLVQSISSTDVAISGNGLFAVKQNGENSSLDPFFYTRNGQFSEDAEGFLRNSAGFYLYGWPLDSSGNRPSAEGDLSSLVPVDVAFLGGLTRETTSAELAINLDADQDDYNLNVIGGGATYPLGNTQAAHFERGLRVFDTLGSAQDITFEYRKIIGPMANATSTTGALTLDTSLTDAAVFPGIAAGDEFTITAGATAEQFIIGAAPAVGEVRVDTVGDLIAELNSATYGGGVAQLMDADLDSSGRLVIRVIDPTANLTLDDTTNTPLFAVNGFNFSGADGVANTPDANPIAGTYTSQGDFPDLANTTAPNTEGWWEVTIRHPDSSVISQGLINFDGDGSINALADPDGNIDIELSNIDWNNGSTPQSIEVDIERLSQFAGTYNVIFSDQNGAELGLRTGVEIDQDGFVIARFSNGATSQLYQLPMITFANVNGLQEVSGTAYTETEESGEENLRVAGEGGAGQVETSVLENSNVDLADEFSRLIIAQRAYSAGTRVINTVDQMTEDLLRLR